MRTCRHRTPCRRAPVLMGGRFETCTRFTAYHTKKVKSRVFHERNNAFACGRLYACMHDACMCTCQLCRSYIHTHVRTYNIQHRYIRMYGINTYMHAHIHTFSCLSTINTCIQKYMHTYICTCKVRTYTSLEITHTYIQTHTRRHIQRHDRSIHAHAHTHA